MFDSAISYLWNSDLNFYNDKHVLKIACNWHILVSLESSFNNL